MGNEEKECVSLFKGGEACREEYTRLWTELVISLLRNQHDTAVKEGRNE